MAHIKLKLKLKLLTSLTIVLSSTSYAQSIPTNFLNTLSSGSAVVQAGGIASSQGKSQSIGIDGLIGDRFSVKDRNDVGFLFGLGYFLKSAQDLIILNQALNISYGLNAFYLSPTKTQGKISQEHMFYNLDYEYKTSQLPVYLAAKASTKPIFYNKKVAATFNVGVGPSVTKFSGYQETPINNATIANDLFTNDSDVVFSFSAGVGLKSDNLFNNAKKHLPVECGYRFFFFSESNLKENKPQVRDALKSGNSIAQSLMCSVEIDRLALS